MSVHKLPIGWQQEATRPIYINDRKSEKTHVNFKASSETMRFVDEYVASRQDPYIKTRSDALNDALLQWVWNKRNDPDLPSDCKVILHAVALTQMARKSERFDLILSQMEDTVDQLVKARDIRSLTSLLPTLEDSKQTFIENAGENHIEAITKIVSRVKYLLRDESK